MKQFVFSVVLLFAAYPFVYAGNDTKTEWYRGSSIVSNDGTVNLCAIDSNKIDLVYLVSTEVLSAKDSLGNSLYQSMLSDADRVAIDGELDFAMNQFGKGDFNFLAPYYHQYTFESISLPSDDFHDVHAHVCDEVYGIMTYYLDSINNGRPFAIVGFSQGAMLALDVLKHFPKAKLRNMVGAYLIGYGINKTDILCENVIPATSDVGFGHTISFNSVMSADAVWHFVHNDAAIAINPVNWRTDSTPASFVFGNDTITATLDTNHNIILVSVPDKSPYHEFMLANPAYKMSQVSPDCLHRWDLLFYTQYIHDNIIKRAVR